MQDLNFNNTEIAFRHKSNKELQRSFYLFKMMSSPALVKVGGALVNFASAIHFPFGWMIKNNVFAQFCGGTSIEESKHTADKLSESGIGSILDYSVEGKTKEEDFDATADEIIRTIIAAKENGHIPFSVFKTTGITRFNLLEKVKRKRIPHRKRSPRMATCARPCATHLSSRTRPPSCPIH